LVAAIEQLLINPMTIVKGFLVSILFGATSVPLANAGEKLRSTETEPSNRHVATLIDEIKSQHVKAIFLENTLNPKVSTEITRETGAKIGGSLYADGLGEGDGSTYEGMFRHNITTVVDSLK
jgi:ABC-type Zn uptake system ZnuABC Zn-binding protein ZnuA